MSGRSRGDGQAFNANPDTGRKGYRMEWEVPDERPEIVYPYPFWGDEEDRESYERATHEIRPDLIYEGQQQWDPEDKAQREAAGRVFLGMAKLCEEITELATGLRAGLPSMPHPRLSRRAQDLRLMLLRGQAEGAK